MNEVTTADREWSEVEVSRPWTPLPPRMLPALLRDYTGDWWLAGGWALDMWLGRPSRLHEDTDVVVFRQDVLRVLEAIPDWIITIADPPGTLRPWTPGDEIPAHVHDIWCRHHDSATWQLQFMVIDGDDLTWQFRRDRRITGPRATMGWWAGNLPVLSPEIQLLYKVKPSSQRRPKDDADLQRIVPRLARDRRRWLEDAVAMGHPDVVEEFHAIAGERPGR